MVLDHDLLNLTGLEGRIADAVSPTLADMGYDLVRVAVLGKERPTVQIMADRADGSLIGIEDCEAISHAVSAVLDVDDPIPGAWNLEVSSAGIDRPLTRARDWERFAGHAARAEAAIPIEGRRRFSGILLGADDTHGRMRLDDGTEVSLPLAELRRAKLVLTDALIEATAPERPADVEANVEVNVEAGQDDGETGDEAKAARGPGRFSGKAPGRVRTH